ncbi:hypothetical protein CMV_006856 [Castanea mollissima]|uniref:Uncharacterized protein n=1 Tax=Castanea mollissima TaxID=60419 RepID=A0A8J4RNY6_9ROSI|nr:hypothetical protein CMV_006856 [Castanea mollissima]
MLSRVQGKNWNEIPESPPPVRQNTCENRVFDMAASAQFRLLLHTPLHSSDLTPTVVLELQDNWNLSTSDDPLVVFGYVDWAFIE